MNAPLQFNGLASAVLPPRPLHLAIGMFDGVHLGHQSVIAAALHSARRSGGLAGVLTFWPHPSRVFRPENPSLQLMPPDMKRRVLASLGVDFLIAQDFTADFARTTAREFIAQLKQRLPALAAVYVGENFRFGRGRAGDIPVLVAEAAQAGFAVFSAPRLNHNGAPISSSRLRALLAAGEIAEANTLLGYAYFAEGVVQPGRRLGHTLGFPTLNLPWEPELKPCFGVYAVTVESASGAAVKGVANYGVRPTVETAGTVTPLLEVHLLEASALTTGDRISVQWRHFLRPEAKFSGLEELRQQIRRDCDAARAFFAADGPA